MTDIDKNKSVNKTLTDEEIKKIKEDKEKIEEHTKEIIQKFIENNGTSILDITIQYTKQYGPGALFVSLQPNTDEADIEYFKLDDLDGGFKKKILTTPNKNSVFYAIKLSQYSYIFERNLEDKW